MSYKSYIHKFFLFSVFCLLLFPTFYILDSRFYVFAFTGPSQNPPNSSGAIASDAANNLAVGTSTTSATTKLLIVASSSADANNYSFRILYPNQNPVLIVRNDGSIGIATSTPGYTLSIQGNLYASGNITCSGSCGGGSNSAANITPGIFNGTQSTTTGNFAFPANLGVGTSTTTSLPAGFTAYQTSTFFGNVGIGTTGPDRSLDVTSAGNAIIGRSSGAGSISVYGYNTGTSGTVYGLYGQATGNNSGFSYGVYGYVNGGGAGTNIGGYFTAQGAAGGNYALITGAGNVGIGTTQPSSTLHVVGGAIVMSSGLSVGTTTVQSAGNILITGTYGGGTIGAAQVTSGLFGSGNFSFQSGLGVNTSTTALPAGLGLAAYGTSTFFGRVGISTTSPAFNLDVVGTGRFTSGLIAPLNQTLNTSGQITVETSSSTLNFYDGTAQQALSPLKAIPFVFENPTTSEDDAIFIFNATSTITNVYAVNKAGGDTVTFNLVWDPNRNLASSSARHLFSSNQAVTATTTPSSGFTLASTTVNSGSVMRFITSAASSSQFTFTVYYKDVP